MDIFDLIKEEEKRQKKTVELIASENFVSENVMRAVGSCLTNKYAEGYPGHRYYGGCQCVDEIELYCQKKWQEVFRTDYHVNVQPHSGSQANMAAIMAVCQPGDTILSMDLNDGGHLTHGSPVSFSGRLYHVVHYGLTDSGYIDYEDFKQKLIKYRPALVIIGASSYPREIHYGILRGLIDEYARQATMLVDMAHVAGLVAVGAHLSPFGFADIITTTTHKTLRGPRGGLIFCKEKWAKAIDRTVFPGVQGGPLMHVIAGKAVAAEEACTQEFVDYIWNVVNNCRIMAKEFSNMGMDVVTGGTDTHMLLLDLSKTHPHVTGKMAQDALDEVGITLNKNMIHGDQRKPNETSGLRIGTAAMTTKGYGPLDFIDISHRIKSVLDKLEEENASK